MVFCFFFFFFFNDTATTEIYTLSLHDALPIWIVRALDARQGPDALFPRGVPCRVVRRTPPPGRARSGHSAPARRVRGPAGPRQSGEVVLCEAGFRLLRLLDPEVCGLPGEDRGAAARRGSQSRSR